MQTTGNGPARILLTVQHPGHVHFFRHAYRELRADGHDVTFVARSESVVEDLFEAYGLEYTILGKEANTLPSLAVTQLGYETRLYRFARRFSPDVIAGIGGVAAAHVSRLLDVQGIVFTDTEHATLSNRLAFPFADQICTPDCFQQDLGAKQYRYPGYHELAYLRPARFSPDPSVPNAVGVDPEERFVVLRITAWNAVHDVGHSGLEDVVDVVDRLAETGVRVLISSSVDLPAELESMRATVEPHQLHDLLAYATLFIGEGATTAAESAVLGTPAVYINTLTAGTLSELEEQYGLLSGFHGPNRHREGIERAVEILNDSETDRWKRRRERLLADKCDPTEVIKRVLVGSRAQTPPEVTG